MAKAMTLRGWATPLLIGAFFLMAGTGLVMFFRFDNGVMAPVHRLFSWIFLIGAIGHIAANVRPFKAHLKSPLGRTGAVVFGALLAISFGSWGVVTTPKLSGSLERTVNNAPLAAIAAIKRVPAGVLIGTLHRQGMTAGPGQSLHAVAVANHTTDRNLLRMVLNDADR